MFDITKLRNGLKMRDPKRISEMLDLIESIWRKNPDLRLGQLLLNIEQSRALYYLEDDELFKELCQAYGL